jgi:hypothetical protein
MFIAFSKPILGHAAMPVVITQNEGTTDSAS